MPICWEEHNEERKHVPVDSGEQRREWDIWGDEWCQWCAVSIVTIVNPCSTCGHPQPRSHHHRWHDWWSQAGAPLSSQHRDDCKTILVGGVHTLRKARAHSTQPQTRFSIFCIMMFHWDAITSHHKRCWRLTRHLESFRVSLFSIDCHFLSYDRHWQGGVPGPSVWCSMHRSPIKYPFYSVSS